MREPLKAVKQQSGNRVFCFRKKILGRVLRIHAKSHMKGDEGLYQGCENKKCKEKTGLRAITDRIYRTSQVYGLGREGSEGDNRNQMTEVSNPRD